MSEKSFVVAALMKAETLKRTFEWGHKKGGGMARGNLKEWPRNWGRGPWTCYVHVMSHGEGSLHTNVFLP